MADRSELGRKIAQYRVKRGLSQRELAQLVHRSEAWLSQVERGVRTANDLGILERIAHVLDVPLSSLAPTAPAAAAHARRPEAVSLRLLLSANHVLRAIATDEPAVDAPPLDAEVDQAWQLAHGARYAELIPLWESLLPRLESALMHDATAATHALLATTYQACAAALAKLEEFDAAWVAADRAIGYAGRTRDPLLVAEGAFRLTLRFQGTRQYQQAEYTARTAAAPLLPLVEQGRPEALSLHGALLLQLAITAARTDRAQAARDHLASAEAVAESIGEDRNDLHTEFGPPTSGCTRCRSP